MLGHIDKTYIAINLLDWTHQKKNNKKKKSSDNTRINNSTKEGPADWSNSLAPVSVYHVLMTSGPEGQNFQSCEWTCTGSWHGYTSYQGELRVRLSCVSGLGGGKIAAGDWASLSPLVSRAVMVRRWPSPTRSAAIVLLSVCPSSGSAAHHWTASCQLASGKTPRGHFGWCSQSRHSLRESDGSACGGYTGKKKQSDIEISREDMNSVPRFLVLHFNSIFEI